jgi:hypothetical protein
MWALYVFIGVKIIHGSSTKELHVLRTSHLRQSTDSPENYCCCASPLGATCFENGYPTTDELVCSAVSEENACHSCTSHRISHVTIYLALVKETRAESCVWKGKSPKGPLCVRCNSGSNATHKNQCPEQFVSCSYHKQPPPKNFNYSRL